MYLIFSTEFLGISARFSSDLVTPRPSGCEYQDISTLDYLGRTLLFHDAFAAVLRLFVWVRIDLGAN